MCAGAAGCFLFAVPFYMEEKCPSVQGSGPNLNNAKTKHLSEGILIMFHNIMLDLFLHFAIKIIQICMLFPPSGGKRNRVSFFLLVLIQYLTCKKHSFKSEIIHCQRIAFKFVYFCVLWIELCAF